MIWTTLTMIVTTYALVNQFKLYSENEFNSKMEEHLHQLIALINEGDNKKIVVLGVMNDPRFNQPLSRLYWQINDNNNMPLFRSASLADYALSLPGPTPILGKVYQYSILGPKGQHLIILECKVNIGDPGVPVEVAVASEHEKVDEIIKDGSTAIITVLSAMGIGLFFASTFVIWSGLQPLRLLCEKLITLRDGTAHQIEGEFPSEIQPVVKELNSLVVHNSLVLERARMQSANLAHGLKTPLAVLATMTESRESGLAHPEDRKVMLQQIGMIQRQIDYTLALARSTSAGDIFGAQCDAMERIGDIVNALRILYKNTDIRIAPFPSKHIFVKIEAQDFDEIIGNILDNACKWSREMVRVSLLQQSKKLIVHVEDDGEGIPALERNKLFRRGKRLDETVPGFGFGLSIANDLIESYGGHITLEVSSLGGLKAVLEMPAMFS